jgi:hypothetical protein
MKTKLGLPLVTLLDWRSSSTQADPLGRAFTYQGRLATGGTPASGSYDFRFQLAADAQGSALLSSPLLTNAVPVGHGLFTVTLDFGPGWFNGDGEGGFDQRELLCQHALGAVQYGEVYRPVRRQRGGPDRTRTTHQAPKQITKTE